MIPLLFLVAECGVVIRRNPSLVLFCVYLRIVSGNSDF